MTLFSRIAGFRCPKCQALQAAYALLTTVRGGALNARLNGFAPCPSCRSKLVLRNATSVNTVIAGTFLNLLMGLLFLASNAVLFLLAAPIGFAMVVGGALIWAPFASLLFGALRARTLRQFFVVEEIR